MKRMLCLLLAVGIALSAAVAAAQTYELECGTNGYLICEDFAGEMPQMADDIFGSLIREGDKVLGGTLFQEHYRNQPGKVNRGGALMAVERNGKILLMSANGKEGDWNAGVETDSFLPEDAQFFITTVQDNVYAHLTIHYGNTAYEIRTMNTGAAYLYEYSWVDETGNRLRMDCYNGEFVLHEEVEGLDVMLAEGRNVPDRLCAWTADALPKTAEALHAFEQAHPLELDSDEAYIAGVNLRERATGESPSWGEYFARVQVLGEQPGKTVPWVHVRLGELEGWVSGHYVHRQGKGDQSPVYSAATLVHPVGRTKEEKALFDMPGGNLVMQMEADTYVHVLGEKDGWLHVIVPRNGLTWKTDWEGTYGFVLAKNMSVGISQVDAMHKN